MPGRRPVRRSDLEAWSWVWLVLFSIEIFVNKKVLLVINCYIIVSDNAADDVIALISKG